MLRAVSADHFTGAQVHVRKNLHTVQHGLMTRQTIAECHSWKQIATHARAWALLELREHQLLYLNCGTPGGRRPLRSRPAAADGRQGYK